MNTLINTLTFMEFSRLLEHGCPWSDEDFTLFISQHKIDPLSTTIGFQEWMKNIKVEGVKEVGEILREFAFECPWSVDPVLWEQCASEISEEEMEQTFRKVIRRMKIGEVAKSN